MMRHIGTIPFTVAPAFWILAVLISWLSSNTINQFLAWIVVVFISVIVHEMGHALVARVWGQGVQIILGPLGGTTVYGGSPLSRTKEFCVILCGPLFGLILAALTVGIYNSLTLGPEIGYFCKALIWANLVWSCFNLLPVHPFDGGKLMGIVLEGLFGIVGMRVSYFLSGLFAILLASLCISFNQLFAGALLLLCAFESFRSWKYRTYFQTTASEKMLEDLEQAELDWQQSHPEKAIAGLESLIKKTQEGEVYDLAIVRLADFLASAGQTKKAYALLREQRKLQGEALKLFQLVSYKLGHWRESLDAGNKIFREFHDPSCAIMNAFAAAHLQDVKTSVNWLTTVRNAEATDMKAILAADDLDSIRSDALFHHFVASCK